MGYNRRDINYVWVYLIKGYIPNCIFLRKSPSWLRTRPEFYGGSLYIYIHIQYTVGIICQTSPCCEAPLFAEPLTAQLPSLRPRRWRLFTHWYLVVGLSLRLIIGIDPSMIQSCSSIECFILV